MSIFDCKILTKILLGVVLGAEFKNMIQNPIFPWQHNITSHISAIFNPIHLKFFVQVLDIRTLLIKILPKIYINI
jgi:hypothetical protein